MAGSFSIGGLMSGLDSNALIDQLVALERQPITRLQTRIASLNTQQQAVRDLRNQLLDLRNRVQDFQFDNLFDQFAAASSDETILTSEVSGETPISGSFLVDVQKLASATVATSSAALGSAIDPNVALDSSGITSEITAGDFSINGVTFTIDPATDSLNGILGQINASAAGVTATYDAVSDRVTFTNTSGGDTSIINFGGADDDSTFLSAISVTQATQLTGGSGSTEATSTRNLGAVAPGETLNNVSFAGGAITAGSFKINGITITVDPTTDALSDVLARINDSDAEVQATYDTSTDTVRIVAETLGSRTIRFEAGTSNFLDVTNLTAATQTAGNDAQFTLNGGAVLTRNTNEISDAISGVTLNLLSLGESTVTVSTDDDAIVEEVQDFIETYNSTLSSLRGAVGVGGVLENDGSIRIVENFLRTNIFSTVMGISGDFESLLDIGISTGDTFDQSDIGLLELDEDAFREALRDDRTNIANLFDNNSDTGIANIFFNYLDDVTGINGFLNERSKSNGIIDQQIESLNDRIDRLEERVAMREARWRVQFSRLEQLSAGFQQQNAALASISGAFGAF